jgi:hypothetical protein
MAPALLLPHQEGEEAPDIYFSFRGDFAFPWESSPWWDFIRFLRKSIFLFCVFSLIFISGNILLYISVLREKHNLIIPENSPF